MCSCLSYDAFGTSSSFTITSYFGFDSYKWAGSSIISVTTSIFDSTAIICIGASETTTGSYTTYG